MPRLNNVRPRRARVAYAEITADVTLTTSTADVAGLTVDVPAGDFPVDLEFSVLAQKLTNAGGIFLYITDSANATYQTIASEGLALNAYETMVGRVQVPPSATARTFKVRALLLTAGGRIQATATGGALGPSSFSADEC